MYIGVHRGTWGITFSLFPLYFIFKEFNVYNVNIVLSLVFMRFSALTFDCLRYVYLVNISRYCMLTLFSNVYGSELIIIFFTLHPWCDCVHLIGCIYLCLPLPGILVLTFLNFLPCPILDWTHYPKRNLLRFLKFRIRFF